MLWPGADEENARSYLRHALWRIRKGLGSVPTPNGHYLISDDISVGFARNADHWLDVARFERDEDQETSGSLIVSVGLYRGELLPGFYDEWAVRERERLEAILAQKMQRLIDRLSEERRWEDLITWAERWISLGGAPEGAYRALMRAHHERGDRSGIAEVYQRCVSTLRRELDVAPSSDTQCLFEELSASSSSRSSAAASAASREPALDVDAGPAPGASPFKGLHYFDEADAEIFFGRAALIGRLADRAGGTSFLGIVGASGSGKSSILRAGLIPAVTARGAHVEGPGADERRTHLFTPTAHPLEALAASVAPGSASTLLEALARDRDGLRHHLIAGRQRAMVAVDQFEELFTLCHDPFEREAFIDNLLAAANDAGASCTVVITLRADFYAHCAEHPALRAALAGEQEYIGRMEAAELRQAIEGPAAHGGWKLEPGLVDILLRDVGDEPGALPLLSHALLEVWHRRQGRRLTIEGYLASGGVHGAIARTAESAFAGLTAEQQAIARRIFLRLTELGEGTQDSRRRASIDELTSESTEADEVWRVMRVLTDARLITTGEKTVEVAHEALIREWPRLSVWLDEDRDALRAQRELTHAALEWERSGRDSGALYRGTRLTRAVERDRDGPATANVLEREFLAMSRAEADREAREREEVYERELEAAHKLASAERTAAVRLSRRATYLAVALLLVVVMAGAAVFFAERSRASAAVAELARTQALLESARGAAANIDSRLGALRDAISPPALREQLISLVVASDPELPAVLRSLHVLSGADTDQLFVIEYRKDVVVAFSDPFGGGDAARRRVDYAHRAVAGSAPDPIEGCRLVEAAHLQPGLRTGLVVDALSPLHVSRPYARSPGEAPSITMVKYNQPCVPYAVAIEVSLRRAPEWMSIALAPTDDAYLIDRDGRLLARARGETEHLRDMRSSDLVQAALSTTEAVVHAGDDPLGAGPALAALAPVCETGWRVIVLRRSIQAQPAPDFDLRLAAGPLGLLRSLPDLERPGESERPDLSELVVHPKAHDRIRTWQAAGDQWRGPASTELDRPEVEEIARPMDHSLASFGGLPGRLDVPRELVVRMPFPDAGHIRSDEAAGLIDHAQ